MDKTTFKSMSMCMQSGMSVSDVLEQFGTDIAGLYISSCRWDQMDPDKIRENCIDPWIFEAICVEIETGSRGVSEICSEFGLMVSTFYRILNKGGAERSERYARAKKIQVEPLLNEIRRLQRDCMEEMRTIEDPRRCNSLQNSYKEQIRHIEWLIGRLEPKKYGDKIDVTTDGGPVVPGTLQVELIRGKDAAG